METLAMGAEYLQKWKLIPARYLAAGGEWHCGPFNLYFTRTSTTGVEMGRGDF
jgi:hypothetical protein